MKRPTIAVTRNGLPGVGIQRLADVAEINVWPDNVGPTAEQLSEFLAGAHGLLSMSQDVIGEELLDQLPDLVAVGQASAGYNNLDLDALQQRGIQASNCPGVLMETTADFTWALILAASRRIIEADTAVRSGEWVNVQFDYLLGQDIYGATLGVIGYGQIGKAVARRAAGFGMNVVHTSRSTESDEISTRVTLEELLTVSDVVSIHTALTPETRHLITDETLALMKPTAVLVNASRGPVVDETALYKALERKQIFAAGLDVFEIEPIGPDNPLTTLPNVVLAPHLASGSLATRSRMVDMAATNLRAAIEGAAMPNTLTPNVTPRTIS